MSRKRFRDPIVNLSASDRAYWFGVDPSPDIYAACWQDWGWRLLVDTLGRARDWTRRLLLTRRDILKSRADSHPVLRCFIKGSYLDVRRAQLSLEPETRALGRTLGGVVADLRILQRAERELDRATVEGVEASDYLTALLSWSGDYEERRRKKFCLESGEACSSASG